MSAAPEPQHRRSLWLAALAAALAVPTAYGTLVWALAMRAIRLGQPPYWGESGGQAVGAIVIFALPISLATMLFFGMPIVFMLRSFRALFVPNVCVAAVISGAFALGVLSLNTRFLWDALLWGAGYGLFAGLVFCAVAGIRWRQSA